MSNTLLFCTRQPLVAFIAVLVANIDVQSRLAMLFTTPPNPHYAPADPHDN